MFHYFNIVFNIIIMRLNVGGAVNSDNDSPFSPYNDINDAGVLTPSSTDEEDLFVKERKTKEMQGVYDPRVDHAM